MEGMAQDNTVLTRSKSTVMVKSAQTTATMNAMHEQLKTLSSASTNSIRPKTNYCWICARNFSHGRKSRPSNKSGHKYEAN